MLCKVIKVYGFPKFKNRLQKGFCFSMKTASKIVFAPNTIVYDKIISQMAFKLALQNYGA